MITPIPTNYFAQRNYLKSDPQTGLLATRQGNRLIAIPDLLLRSIHQSLRAEAGEASTLALYTFGFWWGASFYDRTAQELSQYYQMPIEQMNAPEFLVTMRELWAVHGLGNLALDFSYRQQGLVRVVTTHSILQEGANLGLKPGRDPSYHLEAGFLSAWFSRWAGKDLRACATDWHQCTPDQPESVPFTEFLIGVAEIIDSIQKRVRQGERTASILAS